MCSLPRNVIFLWISVSPSMDCLGGSQTPLSHLANKQIRGSGTLSFTLFGSAVYLYY